MIKRTSLFLVFSLWFIFFISNAHAQFQNPAAGPRVFLPVITLNRPQEWIGPDGGVIAAIAIDPTNSQIIYAGSWGAGVFKSTDGGVTWEPRRTGLGNLFVSALAVDPANSANVYAGTYKGKLYKSIDGGATWFFSGQGVQEEAIVYSIAIDPQTSKTLYIATRGASNNNAPPWNGVIYKSIDGGATWASRLADIGGTEQKDWAYALAIHPNMPGVIFAATHEHGPYRSMDGGENWQPVTAGINNFSTRAIEVNPHTTGGQTILYTAVWTKSGVFQSTNNGENWSSKSDGLVGANIYGLAIDPFGPKTLYAATYNMGVMKSTNSGNSWFGSGLGRESISTLKIDPSNSENLFAGSAGNGLFTSRDKGDHWVHNQAGLRAGTAVGLVVSPRDPAFYYAATYGGGVSYSPDGGLTWQEFNNGLNDLYINALVERPGTSALYALTDFDGLYHCDLEANICWSKIGAGLPLSAHAGLPPQGAFHWKDGLDFQNFSGKRQPFMPQASVLNPGSLLVLAFAPTDASIAYLGTGGAGVYKSTDGGINWQPAGLDGQMVPSLAVDPVNPAVLYAAAGPLGSLVTSQNGGASWVEAGLAGQTVNSLAYSPANPATLFAGTNNGLYARSGSTWTPTGLSGKSITAIQFHPSKPKILFVGTTDGAYESLDGGDTWIRDTAELFGVMVQAITVDPFNPGWVYFSTPSRGVLREFFGY